MLIHKIPRAVIGTAVVPLPGNSNADNSLRQAQKTNTNYLRIAFYIDVTIKIRYFNFSKAKYFFSFYHCYADYQSICQWPCALFVTRNYNILPFKQLGSTPPFYGTNFVYSHSQSSNEIILWPLPKRIHGRITTSSTDRLLKPDLLRLPSITIRLIPLGRGTNRRFHIGGSSPSLEINVVSVISSDSDIKDTMELSKYEADFVWKKSPIQLPVVLKYMVL